MEQSRAGAAALRFHEQSAYRRREGATGLDAVGIGVRPQLEPAIWERDWSIEPYPFKEYETLTPIPLPREWERSEVSGTTVLAGRFRPGDPAAAPEETATGPAVGSVQANPLAPVPVNLAVVARIARYAAGTLGWPVPGRDGRVHTFRAAGGTGARYHLELYLICGELADLPAGVYHYAATDHSLRRLRAGDHRATLIEATGAEPATADAPAVVALTSTFWRNAWRYRERAYRHAFWDAGTTLSQLVAVAGSAGLSVRVVLGYADAEVNALLDIDGEREATVALCAVGAGAEPSPPAPPRPALHLPTRAISAREETFPEIPRAHAATALSSGMEAARWRQSSPLVETSPPMPPPTPAPTGDMIPLEPDGSGAPSGVAATVEELVERRRSVRHYDAETPMPFAAFSALLRISAAGFPADCLPAGTRPYTLYLIVNAVEGVESGLYVHHPDRDAVELLQTGDFREDAQRVAIGQEYTARAHVNLYYLADLDALLAEYGDRGYRLAQLAAASDAGRLHLACPAYGCGAVGSTSFDEEAVDLFSPHAAGKAYLFVTVFGRRRPR